MFEAYLADVIVAAHVAYVSFVVLGVPTILLGWVCGWRWVRNPWFRYAHLGAIAFETLYSMINDAGRPRDDVTLPTRLVRRESCGCPPTTAPLTVRKP